MVTCFDDMIVTFNLKLTFTFEFASRAEQDTFSFAEM